MAMVKNGRFFGFGKRTVGSKRKTTMLGCAHEHLENGAPDIGRLAVATHIFVHDGRIHQDIALCLSKKNTDFVRAPIKKYRVNSPKLQSEMGKT